MPTQLKLTELDCLCPFFNVAGFELGAVDWFDGLIVFFFSTEFDLSLTLIALPVLGWIIFFPSLPVSDGILVGFIFSFISSTNLKNYIEVLLRTS